jgi:cell division septation protein DedD
MSQDPNDIVDIDDDFEFNDGVGDALKEKEDYAFSWPKTISILGAGLFVVILVTFGILEIGKKAFDVNSKQTVVPVSSEDLEPLNDTWDALPETVTAEKPSVKPLIKQPVKKVHAPVVVKKVTPKKSVAPKKDVVSLSNVNGYRVIAGSFSKHANAKQALQGLKNKGFNGYIWSATTNGTTMYKVQAGSFKQRSAAKKLKDTLERKGVSAYLSAY